jgi:hypothetical protein
MHDLTAKRTLVKSPPELWSELSEVDRLARHLDAFGEIKITKLEPEHTVAWEGKAASGTVSIEPSGWGTKVTLRAQLEQGMEAAEPAAEEPAAEEPAVEEPAVAEPAVEEAAVDEPGAEEPAVEESAVEEPALEEPAADSIPEEPALDAGDDPVPTPPGRRRGFLAWLFRQRTTTPAAAVESVPPPSEPVEATAVEDEAEPAAATEPEPVAASELELPPGEPPDPEPVAEPPSAEPNAEPWSAEEIAEPAAIDGQPKLDPQHAQAVLDEVLDTLGAAHHRPFSRG